MDNYILVDKEPVRIYDFIEWVKSFESSSRVIEKTTIGEANVSTVFLGLDHSYFGGKPVLFETMIFGGEHDGYQTRYCTWDESITGHHVACALCCE